MEYCSGGDLRKVVWMFGDDEIVNHELQQCLSHVQDDGLESWSSNCSLLTVSMAAFFPTAAALSSCDRDHMAWKAESTCLSLYRECSLTPDLERAFFCWWWCLQDGTVLVVLGKNTNV